MSYCTVAQLKAYQKITTTVDDTLLADIVARASALIDAYCGRSFSATTKTRYYQLGNVWDNGRLWLDDDLLTVTSLTNGDTSTLLPAVYWLEPRDKPPYRFIHLKSGYSWIFDTDGEVVVTGTWGYSATAPSAIEQAALRMAGYIYAQKDAQVFDTTASPDIGIITIPAGIPKDVKIILDSFRRLA